MRSILLYQLVTHARCLHAKLGFRTMSFLCIFIAPVNCSRTGWKRYSIKNKGEGAHLVLLLFTDETIKDKTDCWEVGQGPVQRWDEQFSLKTTKIALRWIELGMRILCLSLTISSFFLKISKKEVHDTVFSTRPVVLSGLNQSKPRPAVFDCLWLVVWCF